MIRLSTGFVDKLAGRSGIREITENMRIEIRTGTQPATADAADTGTLLWTATANAGAFTAETLATVTVSLTGATANPTYFSIGSKVNGANIIDLSTLPIFTTVAQLAIDLAAAINTSAFNLGMTAVATSNAVILTAPKNTGAFWNDTKVYVTATTLGDVNYEFANGVTCLNGLSLPEPSGGIIEYDPNIQTWSGKGVAEGTPGYFRIKCDGSDDGSLSTVFSRIDGNVAQIGGDMKVSVGSVAFNKLQIVETFTITMPKQ